MKKKYQNCKNLVGKSNCTCIVQNKDILSKKMELNETSKKYHTVQTCIETISSPKINIKMVQNNDDAILSRLFETRENQLDNKQNNRLLKKNTELNINKPSNTLDINLPHNRQQKMLNKQHLSKNDQDKQQNQFIPPNISKSYKPSYQSLKNIYQPYKTAENLFITRFKAIYTKSRFFLGQTLRLLFCAIFLSQFAPICSTTLRSTGPKQVFEMSTDGTYVFSYDTGPAEHQHFREESRGRRGDIVGSYGYVDPDGALRVTQYSADRAGYRASFEIYEPVSPFPYGRTLIIGPIPPKMDDFSQMKNFVPIFTKNENTQNLNEVLDFNESIKSKSVNSGSIDNDLYNNIINIDIPKETLIDTPSNFVNERTSEFNSDRILNSKNINSRKFNRNSRKLNSRKNNNILITSPIEKHNSKVDTLILHRDRKKIQQIQKTQQKHRNSPNFEQNQTDNTFLSKLMGTHVDYLVLNIPETKSKKKDKALTFQSQNIFREILRTEPLRKKRKKSRNIKLPPKKARKIVNLL